MSGHGVRLPGAPLRYLARLDPGGVWRRAGAEERAVLVLSAVGWIALAASSGLNGGAGICGQWRGGLVATDLGWRAIMAAIMTLAMMLPLTPRNIRFVTLRSFPWRRTRAIGWWLAGYTGLWILAMLLMSLVVTGMQTAARGSVWPAAGAFLFAAAWQLTPAKQWALRACHHTQPLYPSGVRGDASCASFGARIAAACIVSCGPLMLAAMAAPTPLLAMAGVFAVALFERRVWRPPTAPTAAVLALVGVGIVGRALLAL